jgi:uncharacterized protein YunC (DUF1805 family)
MFEINKLVVDGKTFQAMKSTLPELPPLLLIKGEKGFIMCGYLNIEVAEKLGAAAATVSGVNSFTDVLNAEIKAATSKAKKLGVEPGKTVKTVISSLG